MLSATPNQPPENLKTKKQLAEQRLKGVKAVGVIHTNKYSLYLYDINDPSSVQRKRKISNKQKAALARGRKTAAKNRYKKRWMFSERDRIEDRNEAIISSQEILAEKDKYLILDTETTGLDKPEIVQIGIIDLEGTIIFDQRIKPKNEIEPEAIEVHGITNEALANEPSFADIYSGLINILKDKILLFYNASFDELVFYITCSENEQPAIDIKSKCLMKMYAEYFGEWSYYYEDYVWQKLGGDHEAIADCQKTLDILKQMAESEIIDVAEAFKRDWEEYEKANF